MGVLRSFGGVEPAVHEDADVETIREVEESPWAYTGDRYVRLAREHVKSSEPLE